jgi:AcrR family transcriptional regulator
VSGSTRPGGRTAQTRSKVLAAVLGELVATGYGRMSVESVAARAGVHKTTIYRRWENKERLVAEALADAADVRTDVTDTGDIDADMRTLARAVMTTLASHEGAATVRAIVAEAPGSPQLAAVIRGFWATRRAQVGPIIEQAITRQQLPSMTDPSELMKYVAAPLYYQLLMTDEPLTEAAADRAAAAALTAARAGVLRRDR